MARQHQLYFGREMPFTDNNGNAYPTAFWVMNSLSIDTINKSVTVSFVAFESAAEFDLGSLPKRENGGSWSKTYTGDAYDKIIALNAQVVGGTVMVAWNIANAVKDTPGAGDDFESFFASAGEIIMPPSA